MRACHHKVLLLIPLAIGMALIAERMSSNDDTPKHQEIDLCQELGYLSIRKQKVASKINLQK